MALDILHAYRGLTVPREPQINHLWPGDHQWQRKAALYFLSIFFKTRNSQRQGRNVRRHGLVCGAAPHMTRNPDAYSSCLRALKLIADQSK